MSDVFTYSSPEQGVRIALKEAALQPQDGARYDAQVVVQSGRYEWAYAGWVRVWGDGSIKPIFPDMTQDEAVIEAVRTYLAR